MTDRTMREKAAKLADINSQIATLQAQADKLKGDIQAEMDRRAVDELKAGAVLVRWKEVPNNRFDTTTFKATHANLYEQYLKHSTTRRFTLVSA